MARWMYVEDELRPVTGPPGPGLLWRGNWSSSAEYKRYDIVHYAGNTYIAVEPNTNSEPLLDGATPNPDWDVFLEGGTGGGTIGDEDSIYLKSEDETVWKITVGDDGTLTTEEVVD